MIRMLKAIAYRIERTGAAARATLATDVIAELAAGQFGRRRSKEIARCVTTAYGGLGYAGIEPKAFPGMFTAYSTSNRGRGDHTYAWTIQAEEGGLERAPGNLAAYVARRAGRKSARRFQGAVRLFTARTTPRSSSSSFITP